ncbi:hypothetical protein FPV67DRAFT_212239 [Lyophyllum atratum]|nr:hypothetical protein FPV67DRAFT_212239 [Lyophyllum atratum]
MVAPLFLIVLALAALPSVGPAGAIVAPQPVDAPFIPNPAQIPLDAVANAAAADLLVNETRRCAAVSFLNDSDLLSRKFSALMVTATSKGLFSTVTSTSPIPVPHSSVSLLPPPRHFSITTYAPTATVSVLLSSSAIPTASLPVTVLDIAQPQIAAISDACREPFYNIGSFNGTDQLIPLGPICGTSNGPIQPTAMVAIIPPKTTVTLIFDGPTIDVTVFAIDAPMATANATLPAPVVNTPTATTTLIDDNNIKFRDVISVATGLFAVVLNSWWTVAGVMLAFIAFGSRFPFWAVMGDVETKAITTDERPPVVDIGNAVVDRGPILAFITFGSRFPFWAVVGNVETKVITDERPPVVDIGNAVVDRGPIVKDGVPLAGVDIVEDPVAVERVIIVDKPHSEGTPSMPSPAVLRRSPPARIVSGRRYNKPKPRSLPKVTSATLAKVCSGN